MFNNCIAFVNKFFSHFKHWGLVQCNVVQCSAVVNYNVIDTNNMACMCVCVNNQKIYSF